MSSVEYIHMSKTEMEMQVNTYDVVFATAIPIDAPNRTLCYESDRPEIVSINSNIGQVRANSIGTANIKVYLESNPCICAICTITVKGYIPVRSIRFPVTEFTLLEGRTMTLGVLVEPSNATNPKVTWRSCSPEIATVSSTGNVKAIKPGVVDIYATAENGSLTAKCTITIEQYVPVRSIRFGESELTLKKSQTKKLTAIVEPSNATYPQVIWHSCCPDVATVDSSGKITPRSPGYADIYATTVDGNFTAYCTVRVVIEDVIIKKVNYFTEVHFESGKIWKCINKDMIYNTENISTLIVNRANYNILATDENGVLNGGYKTYSNEELKLLYAIDPYGVAAYIARYADDVIGDQAYRENKNVLKEVLKYKDKKFEILFDRKPKYFKRVAKATIEWEEATDTSDIDAVVSESESLFGLHRVHDGITHAAEIDAWLRFGEAAIRAIIGMRKVASVILSVLEQTVNTYQILSTTNEDDVANKLLTSYAKTGIDLGFTIFDKDLVLKYPDEVEVKFNKFNILGWANAITTGIGGLKDVLESSIVEKDFCEEIIYYYSNTTNYNVKIITPDGQEHTMQSVYDALKELRK